MLTLLVLQYCSFRCQSRAALLPVFHTAVVKQYPSAPLQAAPAEAFEVDGHDVGRQLLLRSCELGKTLTLQTLMTQYGFLFEVVTTQGETVLHQLVMGHYPNEEDSARILVGCARPQVVMRRNAEHHSALGLVILGDKVQLVRVIASTPNVRLVTVNKNGMNARDVAFEHNTQQAFEALITHGEALFGDLDPAARLGESPRLRFERDTMGARVRLPLPGLDPRTLEVTRVEDELLVGVAGRRRKIALPAGFSRLEVEGVAYRGSELVVSFQSPSSPKTRPPPRSAGNAANPDTPGLAAPPSGPGR